MDLHHNPHPAPSTDRLLPRPVSSRHRVRGRLQRLRLGWRRPALALAAGLSAAAVTVSALSATGSGPKTEAADPAPPVVDSARSVDEPTRLDTDQRVVAIDRSMVALPVAVADVVELVALRPTATDYEAEVITAEAEVVGVTEDAVLLAMDSNAAYRTGETSAVGSIMVLGQALPAPSAPPE